VVKPNEDEDLEQEPLDDGSEVDDPTDDGSDVDPLDEQDDSDDGGDAEGGEDPPAEDEDDRFLRENKGKGISEKVFKKKLRKFKERLAAKEAEWADKHGKVIGEFDGYKKTTTLTPEAIQKYKGLDTVFGRFNEAVEAKPWLKPLLWALGSGDELTPEILTGLQQELGQEIKSPTRIDPTISRAQQQLQAQVAELQQDRLVNGMESTLARQNAEIKKILGDNPAAWKLVNELAVKMAPERGTLADMPDRVALARQVAGLSKASVQAELKKRIPKPGASRSSVRMGSGPAPVRQVRGGGEEEVPDFKDREALVAWLAK